MICQRTNILRKGENLTYIPAIGSLLQRIEARSVQHVVKLLNTGYKDIHIGKNLLEDLFPVRPAGFGCRINSRQVHGCGSPKGFCLFHDLQKTFTLVLVHFFHKGRISEVKQYGVLHQFLRQIIRRKGVIGSRMVQEDPVDPRNRQYHRVGRGFAFFSYQPLFRSVPAYNTLDHITKGIIAGFSCQIYVSSQYFHGKSRIRNTAARMDVCRSDIDQFSGKQHLTDLGNPVSADRRRDVNTDMTCRYNLFPHSYPPQSAYSFLLPSAIQIFIPADIIAQYSWFFTHFSCKFPMTSMILLSIL